MYRLWDIKKWGVHHLKKNPKKNLKCIYNSKNEPQNALITAKFYLQLEIWTIFLTN